MHFSIIIPVYNRPDEVRELLESIKNQTQTNFEVIVVEDGSSLPCKEVTHQFDSVMQVYYYLKPNSGPGLSRNFGAEKASGDFLVFLDSDCILPETYIQELNNYFVNSELSCFGGPDKSHPSFTPIQKAISYSMTSFLTTGGIRGGKDRVTKFHPRSFNMGFSKEVYKKTKGFGEMRFGEDIDLSLRIEKHGYICALIAQAFVYHKRRTDFKKFFKQIYNSGIARINLFKLHPDSLKATHFFPAIFVLSCAGVFVLLCMGIFFPLLVLLLYLGAIACHAAMQNNSIRIGCLSVAATLTQMFAYGLGFINAFMRRVILKQDEFKAFDKNFYK